MERSDERQDRDPRGERDDRRRTVARTLHVDDQPLFCLGLKESLRDVPDLELVRHADDAEAALELARVLPFDLALVDLALPRTDGIELTRALRALQPACKVLGLSVVDEPLRIAQMLQAGAVGYALKTQPIDELLTAIRTVLAGDRYLPPQLPAAEIDELARARELPLHGLTRRERQILAALIRGKSNDDIATELFISRRTVETHRQRILKKLGVHSVVELVHAASRYGFSGD